MSVSANEIITFWFEEHGQEDWFGSAEEFDRKVSLRFTEVQAAAARGELWDWRQSAVGRLAEILVLDQFSRQLFRGQGAAFATDSMSLTLAQEAIGRRQPGGGSDPGAAGAASALWRSRSLRSSRSASSQNSISNPSGLWLRSQSS